MGGKYMPIIFFVILIIWKNGAIAFDKSLQLHSKKRTALLRRRRTKPLVAIRAASYLCVCAICTRDNSHCDSSELLLWYSVIWIRSNHLIVAIAQTFYVMTLRRVCLLEVRNGNGNPEQKSHFAITIFSFLFVCFFPPQDTFPGCLILPCSHKVHLPCAREMNRNNT